MQRSPETNIIPAKGSKAAVFLQKSKQAPFSSLLLDFTDSFYQGSLASPQTTQIRIPLVDASTTETWAVLQHIELVCFLSNITLNSNISSFQAAWCLLGKTHLSYCDVNLLYTGILMCQRFV